MSSSLAGVFLGFFTVVFLKELSELSKVIV